MLVDEEGFRACIALFGAWNVVFLSPPLLPVGVVDAWPQDSLVNDRLSVQEAEA